jgi:hypothetical protein
MYSVYVTLKESRLKALKRLRHKYGYHMAERRKLLREYYKDTKEGTIQNINRRN